MNPPPPIMSSISMEQAKGVVVDVLETLGSGLGAKLYKREPHVYRIELDRHSSVASYIKLKDAFPDYLASGGTDGKYMHRGGIIHDIFRTEMGPFFVCAFTNVEMELCVSFNLSHEPPGDMCVIAEYKEGGPKRQCLYLSGIPLRACANCAKPLHKSYKCARCHDAGLHARYCNKECQRKHWPMHKAVCGGLAK